MSDAIKLRLFEDLIRARSGLNMREQEGPLLQKTLAARMQALRFSAPESYLDLLSSNLPEAKSEWERLFVLLTNQESYFFRDQGQLSVIRDHILPELIQRNRHTRTLRIWSAGCSTGEEPYSLAMMLDQVLPLREDWQILILGTDLSDGALSRARSGLYGAWSFRTLDAGIQQRFFLPRGNKWEVKPHLRRRVTFAAGNLLRDEFPSRIGELHDMDLIVCRNVFIYFGRDAISQVLRKFSATLRPDGYLVTGHAEVHDVALGDLQMRAFPQSLIYQKSRNSPPKIKEVPAPAARFSASPGVAAPVAPLKMAPTRKEQEKPASGQNIARATPVKSPAASPDDSQMAAQATALIRSGRHSAALEILDALLEREPRHLAALCLAAQANANAGRLDEAEALCRRAVEVSPFAPLPYHLLARIAEERGDSQAAKVLLKKVVYLNPASVRGYLELSAIYRREGDAPRAVQMQRTALRALDTLNGKSLVPSDEHAVESPLTVDEMKRQLNAESRK
jgi:chemotaxis protein methyltransferase CheR